MKKGWSGAALALLIAAALYFFLNTSKKPEPQAIPYRQIFTQVLPARSASPPIHEIPTASSSLAPQPSPSSSNAGELPPISDPAPSLSPATVLQNVRRAVRQYGEMFGGNPVGTNPEITSQLGGANPKHVNFIDSQAGMRVNNTGELIDAWNTPYFFHQLSASDMEIHSAGPDRIMWTSDDLVTK